MRLIVCASLASALLGCFRPVAANTYPIILKGTVVMEDGSAPPVTVGLERICSDNSGSAPGPITNKKGEYTWRMEIDPLATRECFIRATRAGYASTMIEVQGLDTTKTTITLPALVLTPVVAEPAAINASEAGIPGRAKGPFMAAMKALDSSNYAEAARQLQAAVMAAPKFAQGWHALGVVEQRLNDLAKARQAFEHAIEADPKLLQAYVMLARIQIKLKDWHGAMKSTDALVNVDPKNTYPEIYLHRAVAQYQLKDLDAGAASAQQAIRLDPKHRNARAEYVLGRILEAKGDTNAAREHISKYLELEPNAADADVVRGHLQNMGKPEGAGIEPELELL